MPRYALEVGKITLKSGKPITADEVKRATTEIRRTYPGMVYVTEDGVEVHLTVNRH